MNRATNAILRSLTNSSTTHLRRVTTRPLPTQVTRLTPNSPTTTLHFNNTHQRLWLSSTPNSILDQLLTHDWSKELNPELQIRGPEFSHETAIYVLKGLDKEPEKAWGFFNWLCEGSGKGFRLSSALYSLMLRILASKDSMKRFWITIRKMQEGGFYIDEETYFTILGMFKGEKMESDAVALVHFNKRMVEENAMGGVVGDVVRVILKDEWSEEVEKKLEEIGFVVSDNFVVRVLKELRSCNPLKALRFFHWVGRREGYVHNSITYNAIARVLGREGSMEEFWNVLNEMKNAGHELDIDTYTKITRHLRKRQLMEDAVNLFELMVDSPFNPSVQDCSLLLQAISVGDNPDADLASRVVKKYEQSGNSLTKAVYDGMHRSLTVAGKFGEAEKILNTMRDAGFEPDNITHSQLVFGLCKANRLEEASQVLIEMVDSGCVPDIKTWTILIKGHCAANQFHKAFLCFSKMKERSLEVDGDLLNVLVDGFIKDERLEEAYALLMDVVDKKSLRPSLNTYKLLVEKLLEVKKLEDVMNLLQLMKKHGYPPYCDPVNEYISKYGIVEDAVGLLKTVTTKEYPSLLAYHHVLKSFIKSGRYSEAQELLYMCPHHIRNHSMIHKLFGAGQSGHNTA